ncbi:hypothetical protein [Bifidobacterium callitrichos]|uniref:hypothetical protein n=1 Tax=Bifidobacterium callitrichos TaxID=762209 RepID=UPI0011B1FEFD|nr:hypothetical protein [Bifidobacterium callitrichos]
MENIKIDRCLSSICALFVAIACVFAMTDMANASEYDPYNVNYLSPQILNEEMSDPAVRMGMKVHYSHKNDLQFTASNLQTQCISRNVHVTWYGLTARQCKAADATGSQFTVFNSKTGKAVAKVDLKNVPLPPIGKSVPLRCVVSVASFALSLPGAPTSVVGWMIKGATALVKAAGIAVNC